MPKIGTSNLVKVSIFNISQSEIYLRGLNNLGHITKSSNLIIPTSLLDPKYLPKINDILSIRANIEGIGINYRATKIYKAEYPPPGFELGLKVIGEHASYYILEIVDFKRTSALNGWKGYISRTRVQNLLFGLIYDFQGELETRSRTNFENNFLDWEIVFVGKISQRMSIAYTQEIPNLVDLPQNNQSNIIDESGSKLSGCIRYLLPAKNYFRIMNSLNQLKVDATLLNIGTPSESGYIYTTEQILRIYNELSSYDVLKSTDVQQI